MQVKVSTQDIKEGYLSKDACPITIALRKRFGPNISVARDFIRYRKKDGKVILVPLPKKAQNYFLDTMSSSISLMPTLTFNLSKEAVKKLRG